jgi:hypothetical protein
VLVGGGHVYVESRTTKRVLSSGRASLLLWSATRVICEVGFGGASSFC